MLCCLSCIGGSADELAAADEGIHLANAEAALRLRQTGAPVSSIFSLSPVVLHDDDPASFDRAEAIDAATWAPVASICSATQGAAASAREYPSAPRSSDPTSPARST